MGEKALVMKSEEIINQLCDVIGSDAVITDVKEREYFSMDVFDIDEEWQKAAIELWLKKNWNYE